jgi:hypothetical protein
MARRPEGVVDHVSSCKASWADCRREETECLDYPIGMEEYYIIERNYQWEIFRGKGALARNIPPHRICRIDRGSIQLREGPGFKKNYLLCWTKLLFTPAMVLPHIGHKSFTQNFTAIFALYSSFPFSLFFSSQTKYCYHAVSVSSVCLGSSK